MIPKKFFFDPRHALLFGSGSRDRRLKPRRVIIKIYPGKRFGGIFGHSNIAYIARMYPGKGFDRFMVRKKIVIPIVR